MCALKLVDITQNLQGQIDEIKSSGGGDTSNLVPKTGDRGLLAGFNTCVQISASESVTEVTIDENSPDDLVISVVDAPLTITFASNNNVAYVKNILLYCESPLLTTVNFGQSAFVDTFYSNGYVNDLALSMMNQIVVTGYSMLDSNGSTPCVLVSNKVLM